MVIDPAQFTTADRRRLLDGARAALECRVRGLASPEPPSGGACDLRAPLFVTLHCHGALRGCVGRVDTDLPLGASAVELAAAAACADPRFPPVCEAELDAITIDVSVLTAMAVASSLDAIQVGRHGVLIESGRRRGLLLPQVAVDHQWTARTLVEQACDKAGLHRDAWRDGVALWRFEAVSFGERSSDPE